MQYHVRIKICGFIPDIIVMSFISFCEKCQQEHKLRTGAFFLFSLNATSQKKVKGDFRGYKMGICPTPFCHNPSYSQIIISPGIPCCFIIVLLTLEGSLWLVWRRHFAGAFSGQADFSWGRKNSGSHPQHLRRPAIPKKLWEWRLLRHEGFSREPVQPKIQAGDLSG